MIQPLLQRKLNPGEEEKHERMSRSRDRNKRSRSRQSAKRPAAIQPPTLVQSATEFRHFLDYVSGQPWLALDTESDSLFRYTPRVCLIQVTVPDTTQNKAWSESPDDVVDFLVDPLQVNDLTGVGNILADDNSEVILHAAENDILTLQRDFGFKIRRLYDTQLGARILGRKGVGLANVLQEEFGVVSDKRMQRTDWGQRPLSSKQLTYAQIDTHYLPALRQRQISALKEDGRWEEAQDAFRMLETIRYKEPEPRTVWQMKQIRSVDEKDLGVLQAVWDWRESASKQLDRPPFKVLGESALLALAQRRPQTQASLEDIPQLGAWQMERFGGELLAAVRKGELQAPPRRPSPARKAEALRTAAGRRQFDQLRRWRTETATARGVDPDIVFSNDTLLRIAACQPASVDDLLEIPTVSPWKAQAYGRALLSVLMPGRKR